MNAKALKSEDMAAYLAETRGVERDYVGELQKSRTVAWRIAGGSLAVAASACAAVALMAPLKSVETVVLRVDNATGAVDVVQKMADQLTSYGEVVDKYWLNQYVLNREGYDYNTIQMNYDATALLSSPDVQGEFFRIYEGAQARDKVLGNGARVLVTVKSITPNEKLGTAVVRFSTITRRNDGRTEGGADWIATLAYKYVKAPISEQDRRVNPLGFQVTSYRVDPETVVSR